jgi:hypothetical protein
VTLGLLSRRYVDLSILCVLVSLPWLSYSIGVNMTHQISRNSLTSDKRATMVYSIRASLQNWSRLRDEILMSKSQKLRFMVKPSDELLRTGEIRKPDAT